MGDAALWDGSYTENHVMTPKVRPIPDGYRTLTPHLTVDGGLKALAFYAKAFGAREVYSMKSPDGRQVLNALLSIGDSVFMLNDPSPQAPGLAAPTQAKATTAVMHLYVEDCDAQFQRAVAAGAAPVMPPTPMFWGDRYGLVADPFGHHWAIATRIEEPTPEEREKRSAALAEQG